MKFSSLDLKVKYDSDEDDIIESVHIPLLSNADRYDRAVGYFSSKVLLHVASGLEKFVNSNGKMRLIIGDPLSDDEYEAVIDGTFNPIEDKCTELTRILTESDNRDLKILTYLVATKRLDIKFAFTHKGMFHKKIGIFYNKKETVVFSGSANETIAGLSKYNSEEISLFLSWRDSFNDYGQIEIDNFNSLWDNNKKRTKVISINSKLYQKIQSKIDVSQLYTEIFPDEKKVSNEPFFKYSFPKSSQHLEKLIIETKIPVKPLMINDRQFELYPHQTDAIASWRNSDCRGLFKLATGAGKTFTAITAAIELYEERRKYGKSTFVVISVPYIELANQWVKELIPFNISPIKCYESSVNWISKLNKKILRFISKTLDFTCVVVVNKTLSSNLFQTMIGKVDIENMLFIGDECHHLGSQGYFEALPQSKYRIGLSATPFRMDEDELEGSPFPNTVKTNLLSYFKGIVSEYSLSDAIRDGILTPYRYDLVPVYLTEDEQEKYEEYSFKIQNLILRAKSSKLQDEAQSALTNLCGARSRLLATCSGKIPALISYLMKTSCQTMEHALIYVGEGLAPGTNIPYINQVTNTLHNNNIKVSKFTSEESSSERRSIMQNFKDKNIDALVAMKVLDEGIDVPVCKTAYILASTRNPRQYVQRRGRVLRKSSGKNEALIVDFVVLPLQGTTDNFSQNLRRAELERINDFKLTSINSKEVENRVFELGIY